MIDINLWFYCFEALKEIFPKLLFNATQMGEFMKSYFSKTFVLLLFVGLLLLT